MFRRKTIRPDGHPFSPAELELYKQRHVELEKRFIKAALKSVISSGVRVRIIIYMLVTFFSDKCSQ